MKTIIEHNEFLKTFHKGKEVIDSWNPENFNNLASRINVIDFFCCAGGMTLGFAALNDFFIFWVE